MQALFIPIAFLAGGLARRVAGGVLDDWLGYRAPGTLARVLYALIISGLAVAGGAVWWFGLVLAVNVFVGHVARGLWEAGSMGRRGPGNSVFSWRMFARDMAALSLGYGLGQVVVAVALAVWLAHPWWALGVGPIVDAGRQQVYHWLPLVFGGLSAGPAYVLSWAFWERRWLPFWRGVSRDPLQLGEWLAGGAIGIGALFCTG